MEFKRGDKRDIMFRPIIKRTLYMLFVLGFAACAAGVSATYSLTEEGKNGTVVYVDDAKNYIFVNLGRNDVKEGDSVRIYNKDSELIASGSVKMVMDKMSEVSILEKTKKIGIKDRVFISEPKAAYGGATVAADSAAKIDTKTGMESGLGGLRAYEGKAESALNSEISSLKEEGKNLREEIESIKASRESEVAELKNELDKLKAERDAAEIPPQAGAEATENMYTVPTGSGQTLAWSPGWRIILIGAVFLSIFPVSIFLSRRKPVVSAVKPAEKNKNKEEFDDGTFNPRKGLEKFFRKISEKESKDIFK
ncbi:MAG: hypothetical protein JW994_02595 [Candidatus Omnitrophica bacterium]|nr:hypothetical protein [Candidatus Omnitrophota bacterium]